MQGNRSQGMNQDVPTGANVYDSNGHRVGTVLQNDTNNNYLVVEKGWLFKQDVYIPRSAISNVTQDGVQLRYSKDELENQDWSQPPAADQTVGRQANRASARTNDRTTQQAGNQDVRVPLREEELVVGKRQEEVGHVHLHKDVVTEQQNVAVPVSHEEVQIERVAVDPAATSDDAFVERDIDVPVMGEDVVAGKRVKAAEEIRLHKETVTEQQQVSDTVRKERLHVEGDPNVQLNADGLQNDNSNMQQP